MKKKCIISVFIFFISLTSFSQKFSLGDKLFPNLSEFKLLGISSLTNVATYKYIGVITDKYLFNRKIGEIIVGFKSGIVVTTIYNLIPKGGDIGVPQSFVNMVQQTLPFPLTNINGTWGVNIDKESISISRVKNSLTFNKDRIMLMSSVKHSILSNN